MNLSCVKTSLHHRNSWCACNVYAQANKIVLHPFPYKFIRFRLHSPSLYNHVHKILRLFLGLSKFFFPQKWNKACILVINWYVRVALRIVERLKTFIGNQQISGKSRNFIEQRSSAQSSFRNENFVTTGKTILKNRNQNFYLFHLKFIYSWLLKKKKKGKKHKI